MLRYRKGLYDGTDQSFTPNGKKYIPKIDRRGNIR